MRGAASADVYSGFVVTSYMVTSGPSGGVRFIPYGGTSSVQISPTNPLLRFVRIEASLPPSIGPAIVGTVAGTGMGYIPLSAVTGAGAVPRPSNWTTLPGHETLNTGTIAWQYHIKTDGTSLWMVDQRLFATYNVFRMDYSTATSRWVLNSETLSFESVTK